MTEPPLTDQPWEPDPYGRIHYTRASDGQLGWMIHRDGKRYIKLNRPSKEILEPYDESRWMPVKEHRPLRVPDVAEIALAADKLLCRKLGLHDEANREWLSMQDEDRRDWIEYGPEEGAQKARLDTWAAIMVGLKPHTQSK